MRSFAPALVLALSLASAVAAHGGHHDAHKRLHGRNKAGKAWGRRDVASGTDSTATATITAAPGDLPTVVPDNVVGQITISNLEAAAPQVTASAVGADRGETAPPPTCASRAAFGEYCDPVVADCCAVGTTCMGNVCQYLCGVSVTEPYCETIADCDTTKGYVCTANRCRPPVGAKRVQIGEACNQGGLNTRFCYPSKAICMDGVCQQCTLHA